MAVVERLWQLGTGFSGCCHCREVAVVKRFKQESMYGLSAGTKKVAVVERWPLVEVRLYYHYYCYLKKKNRKERNKTKYSATIFTVFHTHVLLL